jgi:chromate transporter
MLLPGPEAQQLAVYIGWMLHRTWGGIVAGTLFVLPSLFILAALTYIYLVYGDVTFVKGIFNGIKPAVVAIVVFAAWRIGSRALKNNVLRAFAAASFLAIFAFHVPFPYIVLAAGILGYLGGKFFPGKFKGWRAWRVGQALRPGADRRRHPSAATSVPTRRLAALIVLFLALGRGDRVLPGGTLTDMGGFFTKAALVTFGGAYAVLPYVYQVASSTTSGSNPAR